jgi:uncharacterized glyoxalase superfamily protein PhnB
MTTEYGGLSYPALCPYLFYEDTAAAMKFLEQAFGFRERLVTKNDDGTLSHVEMERGDAVVMMGTPPDYTNPKRLGGITVGIYVHVDDVDAVYQRARDAGAQLEGEPADQPYGVRSFGAIDPEGHQWWFSQPLSTIS